MSGAFLIFKEGYLEETYGLTNEKKIDNAIGIVANENKYHPIRDY